MDVVGAWLRQLLRAGTAAAVVPVALLAALLVIALGSGGLGGLGSIGQLVAGPGVPEIDAGPVPSENVGVAPVAPGGSDRAPARAGASTARSSDVRRSAPATGAPTQRQGSSRRIAPVPGSSSTNTPREPVAPPLTPGTPPPPPPPPAAAPRPPGLGEVLSSTVNGVVVGLQTLLDHVGRALGLQP